MRKWLLILGCLAALLALGQPARLAVDGTAEIPVETRYIALTFDDGPNRETTEQLLDGLRERGASATFFLVGERIAGAEDLILRMKAEGHQVGNHTWSHVRLEGGADTAAEIGRTETALEEILGGGDYWLRPPYGLIGTEAESQIQVPMVKWSVDPRDWETRNTATVLQRILEDAEPNAIILLHDIYPTSVEAALQAVDWLQAEGYLFVTVEELLALNGVEPEAGTLYRTG